MEFWSGSGQGAAPAAGAEPLAGDPVPDPELPAPAEEAVEPVDGEGESRIIPRSE
jgi:hypothetical protein